MNNKIATTKLIQISDTHLFADDALDMFGVKTNLSFRDVVEKIRKEELHDTDMILLTGDVSQDETAASYQKAVECLSTLNVPIYWIPGNHDHLQQIETVFSEAKHFYRKPHLTLADWHLIFLNTKMDGMDAGYLSPTEIDLLKQELANAPRDKKIAIIMHHHPAPVGTPLIDQYILKNHHDFWEIVTGTAVKLIIFGHVHGDYHFMYQDIMLESTPATCLQWEKGTSELKTDLRIGYKIYRFHEASYETEVKLW